MSAAADRTPPDGVPEDAGPARGASDEIDLLLPWHAVERLAPEDAARVQAALDRDPARARHFALAQEERAETVMLNQALGAPSRAARDALFGRIAAEGRPAPAAGLADRLRGLLARLRPATLAWVGAAATLVIALQAGLLARAYLRPVGTGYETASGPGEASAPVGTFVLVAFAPTATVGEVEELLREGHAVIVDGPRAGGLFRLRVAEEGVGEESPTARIERMRARTAVVRVLALEMPARRW